MTKYMYTDYELSELRNALKRANDVMRNISNRFEVRKSDLRSFSLEQAKHVRAQEAIEPNEFYFCKFGSHFIQLNRVKGGYSIISSDFKAKELYRPYESERFFDGLNRFGFFDDFLEAKKAFFSFVVYHFNQLCDTFILQPKDLF